VAEWLRMVWILLRQVAHVVVLPEALDREAAASDPVAERWVVVAEAPVPAQADSDRAGALSAVAAVRRPAVSPSSASAPVR
jgi:hypothetical protein